MMKFTAFDLEIARVVEGDDWKGQRPLGISCAALTMWGEDEWEEEKNIVAWYALDSHGSAQISPRGCATIVRDLLAYAKGGYTIVTWNGGSFDFDILAEESGMRAECAELARNHVDMMAIVTTLRGHFLGLDTAAQGMGIQGKRKTVTLRDGSVLEGMNGAMAPTLWQQGEYDAVLDYLKEDVRVTLELAEAIERERVLRWTARSGVFCARSGAVACTADVVVWLGVDAGTGDRAGICVWTHDDGTVIAFPACRHVP